MAEQDKISIQEIAVSNMITIEALIRLIVEKGLLDRDAILDKIKEIQADMAEKGKGVLV